MHQAFDNEIYIKEQTTFIRDRMRKAEGRLYLEFGGKLLNDFHAARVLPGYDPNIKEIGRASCRERVYTKV